MTPRQRELLQTIVEEFIRSANAVGSSSLKETYGLDVSSATIRSEMAELMRGGYLSKSHSSSGRIPTQEAYRIFIREMMDEYDVFDVIRQEQLRQSFHSLRFEKESLLRSGIKLLSEISGNVAVALVGSDLYYAGLPQVINSPEFENRENLIRLLSLLEDYSELERIFSQAQRSYDTNVLVGDELGDELSYYSIIFAPIKLHGKKSGYISVIGPNRMDYVRIIPAVRFVSRTISSVVIGW